MENNTELTPENKEEVIMEENPTSEEALRVEPKSVSGNSKKRTQMGIGAALLIAVIALVALEFLGVTNFLVGPEVAARVNGASILQSQVDDRITQILASPQAAGINVEDPTILAQLESQILQELINNEILLSSAKAAGFATTPDALEAEYQLIVTQVGGEEILSERLAEINLSNREFRNSISDQLTIQAYIEDNTDIASVTITEEEVVALYEQLVGGTEGAPELETVRAQVETQLLTAKQQEITSAFIAKLRGDAEIEILTILAPSLDQGLDQ